MHNYFGYAFLPNSFEKDSISIHSQKENLAILYSISKKYKIQNVLMVFRHIHPAASKPALVQY